MRSGDLDFISKMSSKFLRELLPVALASVVGAIFVNNINPPRRIPSSCRRPRRRTPSCRIEDASRCARRLRILGSACSASALGPTYTKV